MQIAPLSPPAAGPRLAVIGTPRSGNTWLRRLLGTAYAVPELAAHTPAEVDWGALPAGCALQLHWRPTASLLAQLAAHRFTVVALCRHPLDVLVSVLHFCRHEPLTHRWLGGEGGCECGLYGALPR